MHGLITSKEDTKVSRSFTRHKKSASESVVDPRLFHTGSCSEAWVQLPNINTSFAVRTPSSLEEEEAITAMSKSKSLSPRNCSPTPAAKISPRNRSPGKVSPRRGSPSKVSPRRGSPAKVSPRSCEPAPSPAKISPRNYAPTPPPPPADQHAAGMARDQYSLSGVASHGKRVPRNAVSVAIAT